MAKQPHHNLQAEQAVLAALLLEGSAIIKVSTLLKPEDFYRPQHQLIYSAMGDLYARGDVVELVSLTAYMENKQQLEAAGGLAYIYQLSHAAATAANVEQHAKIVRAESLRRQLESYGQLVAEATRNGQEVTAQLEQAFSDLNKLMHSSAGSGFAGMGPLLEAYMDKLSSSEENNYYNGLPTSYEGLDELLNGLQPSDFVILAARPSMGKTAFLMNLIYNILQDTSAKEHVIGMFSMEMSTEQLMGRLTSLMTGLDSRRLQRRQLEEEEWDTVWQAVDRLNRLKLWVDDTGGLSMTAVRNRARRLQAEQGLDILFIDYVQLMASGEGSQDRQQAIADISRGLKALARELRIPVVAISQLSRAVEGRQDKRPLLSDIRESGSLEQDADVVMFLYRDDYYNKSASKEPGVTELIIAKHRNGPVGTLKFYFEKECMRFIEMG